MPDGMPPAERWPHGVRARYSSGCRCNECRAANTAYEKKRARIRRKEGPDIIVSATRARRHMKRLSKKGVGRRAIGAACDVGDTTLQKILSGKKTHIRRSTERKILEVDSEAISDSSHVSAAKTWELLNRLIANGWSKAELARRLGYKRPALQLKQDFVLAKNALKVRRLYAQLINLTPSGTVCRCADPLELPRDDVLLCARCELPTTTP